MREYLFRGKRIDTNEWVYGHYYPLVGSAELRLSQNEYTTRELNCHYILVSTLPDTVGWDVKSTFIVHKVIAETIGQLSGHENKLFEGDIVNYVTGNPKRYVNCVVRFGEYEIYTKVVDNDPDYNNDAGEVEKHIGFYLEDGSAKIPIGSVWIEKIGNIFDNPELFATTTNT